jgi:hypothetical protein
MTRVARISHDERGAIMVMFALALPMLLVFAALVVDVANWFEHKRHLQMEADAAALAGGQLFSAPCDSTTDAAIRAEVLKYSGIGGSEYNAQIGGTPPERLHMAVNSKTWPLQSSPVDSTVIEDEPCGAGMVDVKLTETDVPWFFGVADALGIDAPDFINARARVSILKVDQTPGGLPVGVPDSNPKQAQVQFINEDTGAVLGQADLTRVGTFNGLTKWEVPATSAIPVTVSSQVENIGMRAVMSGGTAPMVCGQPLVSCYDVPNGMLHVRGWSDQGTGPIAKSIALRNTTCDDAYFVYITAGTCPTGMDADIDFGTTDPASLGITVTASTGKNNNYSLSYDATDGLWKLPADELIPIAAGAGPVPIELRWQQTQGTRDGKACRTGGANPDACKGTFGTVQRPFSGSDASTGAIRIAKIYESGLPLAEHSLKQCNAGDDPALCTHNLTVELGLVSGFEEATSVDSPVVALRVIGGSQNQSLDCDPWVDTMRDELIEGCRPTYAINEGTPCPNDAPTLWESPQPWNCVALKTGGREGQVTAGMNGRILGSVKPTDCTNPSRWAEYWNTGDFLPDKTDKRIINLFMTPYGSFDGSGRTTVPVINFATFYVTGWTGQPGFPNPCQGRDSEEIIGDGDPAWIYGRFIKYVETLTGATGSTPCDFADFGSCTPVLTE